MRVQAGGAAGAARHPLGEDTEVAVRRKGVGRGPAGMHVHTRMHVMMRAKQRRTHLFAQQRHVPLLVQLVRLAAGQDDGHVGVQPLDARVPCGAYRLQGGAAPRVKAQHHDVAALDDQVRGLRRRGRRRLRRGACPTTALLPHAAGVSRPASRAKRAGAPCRADLLVLRFARGVRQHHRHLVRREGGWQARGRQHGRWPHVEGVVGSGGDERGFANTRISHHRHLDRLVALVHECVGFAQAARASAVQADQARGTDMSTAVSPRGRANRRLSAAGKLAHAEQRMTLSDTDAGCRQVGCAPGNRGG